MKVVKVRFNLKKFIRNMLLVIVFIVLLSMFVSDLYAYKEKEYKKVIVGNGDTLWSIATCEQNNNEYYKNKDLREIIYNIKKTNNLESNILSIGQELLVEIKD